MVKITAFIGSKMSYLLLIGFAAAVTVITITTVVVIGPPEPAIDCKDKKY